MWPWYVKAPGSKQPEHVRQLTAWFWTGQWLSEKSNKLKCSTLDTKSWVSSA